MGPMAKVCKSGKPITPNQSQLKAEPATYATQASATPGIASFHVNGLKVYPAPTINAPFLKLNGQAMLTALSELGADISVAGLDVVKQLRDHRDNLLPSHIRPRTLSRHRMYPIGKLPVKIKN